MRSRRPIFKSLALLILVILLLAGWTHARAIQDWWKLRDYTAPANVVSVASEDTLTPEATHIFYVNHPQLIANVATFRQGCSESEQTIVLGCYHPDQNGIDIYDVQDSRLHGVQEVTAAHEMLHAAYDRLSSGERSRVDGLLQDYYNNNLHDQRIISTINAYKKTEPNDVVNEMHSVFGTEVADLPAALESYYSQYFSDRATVVDYAQSYEGEFTSRLAQIDADDVQLADLKTQIDSEEQSLNNQLNQINSDRSRLDQLRSSGQAEQYNAQVPAFNAEVDGYNRGVTALQSDIANYNSLVSARNSIATELRGLDQSLDTRLTPQTAQ